MTDSITVCSWNMQQNPDAWDRLAELRDHHGVQIALLQEAVPPRTGNWVTHPDAAAADAWVISAHADRRRNFASVVVLLDENLELRPVRPEPLGKVNYGKFAVSHPGQFAVADISTKSGWQLMVVSLYGIWDRDRRYLFSEATLHRAISDLTILLQDRARMSVILAGDLNIFHEWDRADYDAYWAPRYDTVFTRLAAYNLKLLGTFGEGPLDGCHCGRRDGCRHVRTFAYQRKADNHPNQLDYVFASPPLHEGATCRVLTEQAWRYSDHLPVISKFQLR